MMTTIEDFEALAHARRSTLLVDPERPVERTLVERLCRLVPLAPNHKRTAPWLLAAFDGDARERLGALLAQDMVDHDPEVAEARLVKTRTKYQRAPVIVLIGCRPDDDARRHAEDLHAVAAGVQHLLLGATAAGLATLWSSPPRVSAPRTVAASGFPHGTELVAVVYLGWPSAPPPPPTRAEVTVQWVA